MANPHNLGTLTGRVAQDIREFPNGDGSKVLLLTLAVDNNFASGADRKVKTQFIPVRAFLGKTLEGRGSWDRVGKGDLISLATRISCEPYTKDGQTVYPAPTIEADGFPQFLEPKAVTEARAARNATAAPETAAPAAAPETESPEAQIARLQQEIVDRDAAAAAMDPANTSPFANAA